MPYKNDQKQKESQKQYYLENKAKYMQERRDKRRRNKEFVLSQKTSCSVCEMTDKVCLDFHHNGGKIKNVSQLVNEATTIDKLKEEIAKCSILCANCHKKHHLPEEFSDGSEWKNFNNARREKRRWFAEFMSKSECVDCGEDDRRCLEFHHLRDKLFTISYLLTSGHSLDRLKEEMAKCDIVCSNCHRKRHGARSVSVKHNVL